MITVGDIYDVLQQKAPFETAETWDNSGLLIGARETAVSAVYVALDITTETVRRAVACGAQLIVSHHPVIFEPLRAVTPDSPVYAAVQAGLCALCAHTNVDKAVDGVNDALARQLGLTAVTVAPDGMCRIGLLPDAISGEAFARLVSARLDTAVRARVGAAPVRRVALCGGAGGDEVLPLLAQCDAALTGELKHHHWLAVSGEKTLVEGGHYATEIGIVPVLAGWLQQQFPTLTVICEERQQPYSVIKD